MEIYTIELEKIYLPLFLLVNDKKIEDINFNNLLQNMNSKKRKYFLYLPLDFLKLINLLKKESFQGRITKNTKKLCKRHIEYEYIRLKRILGFPNKFEEYFHSHIRYSLFKNTIYFSQIALLFSITILGMVG